MRITPGGIRSSQTVRSLLAFVFLGRRMPVRLGGQLMPRKPSISAEETFYSIAQAAERANVSASTIRRAIRDDTLPALKVRGSVRIRKTAMDAWLLGE